MTRDSYGPEERHLLETTAARIYSNAVAHGSLRADDPRIGPDSDLRPARDLLVDLGLLREDESQGRLFPVDPAAIQSQVVVPLGVRGAELLPSRRAGLMRSGSSARRSVRRHRSRSTR